MWIIQPLRVLAQIRLYSRVEGAAAESDIGSLGVMRCRLEAAGISAAVVVVAAALPDNWYRCIIIY